MIKQNCAFYHGSNLAAKLQIEGVIIERDSVSRIEIGTRFVADYELLVLCKVLNVTPQYLLGIFELYFPNFSIDFFALNCYYYKSASNDSRYRLCY